MGQQNPNECLNKVICSRCPKEVWVILKTMEQAAFVAAADFNNGSISFLKILYHLGISSGHFS